MELDKVKKEILADAKAEAKKLLDEAESEKKLALQDSDQQIKRRRQEIEEELKAASAGITSQAAAEEKSRIKRTVLSLQKEMIDKVFADALEHLRELSDARREKHIKLLMKKQKGDIILCAKKDLKNVKGGKEADIGGGLIFVTGNTRVDLSYETMLEDIRKDNLAEIQKVLFENGIY